MRLSGGTLSFQGQIFCLALRQRAAFLGLHEVEGLAPRKALHLGQALDWDQRGQGLAFSFDDEFVVPKGDPIEHVANPLSDVDGRDFFRHDELVQPL